VKGAKSWTAKTYIVQSCEVKDDQKIRKRPGHEIEHGVNEGDAPDSYPTRLALKEDCAWGKKKGGGKGAKNAKRGFGGRKEGLTHALTLDEQGGKAGGRDGDLRLE